MNALGRSEERTNKGERIFEKTEENVTGRIYQMQLYLSLETLLFRCSL